MKKKYKVYSGLNGRDYIEIEIDTEKLQKVLDEAGPYELAEKMGLGIDGFITELYLDPTEPKIGVAHYTTGTRDIFEYTYPIFTINGLYDVPVSPEELVVPSISYYWDIEGDSEVAKAIETIKKYTKKYLPELAEKEDIAEKEAKEIYETLQDERYENEKVDEAFSVLYRDALLESLAEDIAEALPRYVEDVIRFYDENFEIVEEG